MYWGMYSLRPLLVFCGGGGGLRDILNYYLLAKDTVSVIEVPLERPLDGTCRALAAPVWLSDRASPSGCCVSINLYVFSAVLHDVPGFVLVTMCEGEGW